MRKIIKNNRVNLILTESEYMTILIIFGDWVEMCSAHELTEDQLEIWKKEIKFVSKFFKTEEEAE